MLENKLKIHSIYINKRNNKYTVLFSDLSLYAVKIVEVVETVFQADNFSKLSLPFVGMVT